MQDVETICLTIDLWSNRQMRSFMVITGYFVKDWTLSSVMLACTRFCGRHTVDYVLQQYEDTMAKYQISHKVSHIVTDSASNILKAFSFNLPGFDSSPDDEHDYKDQDNLSDEEADPAAFDHLPDHITCFM